MMETITPEKVAVLIDAPVERVVYLFGKVAKTPTDPETDKHIEICADNIKPLAKDFEIDIKLASKAVSADLEALIADIQDNFTKNKAAMEFVYKAIVAKVKPNKAGAYPLTVTIPKSVGWFITDDQRSAIIDSAVEYLPYEILRLMDQFNISIR